MGESGVVGFGLVWLMERLDDRTNGFTCVCRPCFKKLEVGSDQLLAWCCGLMNMDFSVFFVRPRGLMHLQAQLQYYTRTTLMRKITTDTDGLSQKWLALKSKQYPVTQYSHLATGNS